MLDLIQTSEFVASNTSDNKTLKPALCIQAKCKTSHERAPALKRFTVSDAASDGLDTYYCLQLDPPSKTKFSIATAWLRQFCEAVQLGTEKIHGQ